LVEGLEVRVDRLVRTAAEEDRKSDLPSLELPFVEESGAGNGSDGYGRGTLPGGRKDRRGTGLIVIFDEADQFLLVGEVRAQMEPHALGAVVFETVVQALVVTVVEPCCWRSHSRSQ
jgi:hypothetical protein